MDDVAGGNLAEAGADVDEQAAVVGDVGGGAGEGLVDEFDTNLASDGHALF